MFPECFSFSIMQNQPLNLSSLKKLSYDEIKKWFCEYFYAIGGEAYYLTDSMNFSDLIETVNCFSAENKPKNLFFRPINRLSKRKLLVTGQSLRADYLHSQIDKEKKDYFQAFSDEENNDSQKCKFSVIEHFELINKVVTKFSVDLFADIRPINSFSKKLKALQIYDRAEFISNFFEFLMQVRNEYYTDSADGIESFLYSIKAYWDGILYGVIHQGKLFIINRPEGFLLNGLDITSIQKCVSCRNFFLIIRKKKKDRYCCSEVCTQRYKAVLDRQKYHQSNSVYTIDRNRRENARSKDLNYKTPPNRFTAKSFNKLFRKDEFLVSLSVAWTATYRQQHGDITREKSSQLTKIEWRKQPVILDSSVFKNILTHQVMSEIIVPRAVFQQLTDDPLILENEKLFRLWKRTWKASDNLKRYCSESGFLDSLNTQNNYIEAMRTLRKIKSPQEKIEFARRLSIVAAAITHNSLIVTGFVEEFSQLKTYFSFDLMDEKEFFQTKSQNSNSKIPLGLSLPGRKN
jgi:hypothetical protein